MKIITYEQFQTNEQFDDIERNKQIDEVVLDIISNVRKSGDRALFNYAEKFDDVALTTLLVEDNELDEAETIVSEVFKETIDVAARNIRQFHEKQVDKSWFFYKENGIMLGQQITPMDRVGVYIPGG